MPCSCSSGEKYQAQRPDGSFQNYRTQAEADADVRRNGGTVTTLR